MKAILLVISLFVTITSCGQSHVEMVAVSDNTQRVVAAIEKINVLMGSAIGEAGERPRQYDNFALLQEVATPEELNILTDHANGVVRCYAFWALFNKRSANLVPIITKHIHDTTLVKTQFGCIGSGVMVGDYFINLVAPYYNQFDTLLLTVDDYKYIDSILVFTPNNLRARNRALFGLGADMTAYLRLKELVKSENNHTALEKLASFQKEEDVPLILSHKYKGHRGSEDYLNYSAISAFPHPAFLPELNKELGVALGKNAWHNEWRGLYEAIASYRNDTALNMLKRPLTQAKNADIRKYHIGFVFEGAAAFYTPIYNDLLWDLWEHEERVSPAVFNRLYTANPVKGRALIINTLRNADNFYYLSTDGYMAGAETPGRLLYIMMDTLLIHERAVAVKLINMNIRTVNVHSFREFADIAGKLKDASLVESLFARLETDSNAHVYLKAAEVLISFKEVAINNRLAKAAVLKKGWGRESFEKLLKENSIL